MTNDNVKNDNGCSNSNSNNSLSPKERLEMFQSSIQQLEQQSEIKNVRQLLHERYMQSKAENQFPKMLRNLNGGGNRIKIGRQMARVFRFETGNNNNLRNRRNPRHQQHEAPNRYGFGAPFLMISLLLFIIINLRRKTPGELSAYSVFNPNCRPIASVASNDQPREQILLGFGPL
ncbi:SAYSvFN domain-containing protein 1 [Dermatophagoides pteronyssinus]|uniref:SAYSvFN domain-containing protein 1 n=1 Tax=Dermatophagoides pteronyssinus TaxID=6956 RepID=A0ABQ8IQP7_DERPT|nr:SAYSvFN domain-containing protein 1 [Dermatophagoides pteronyssinus]